MHLCEEYLSRHKINIPCVKHCFQRVEFPTHSYCFVKSVFWNLLAINWVQEPNRVGYYNIQKIEPNSNGFIFLENQYSFTAYNKINKNLLTRLNNPVSIYYDDFEDFVLSLSFQTVTNYQEVMIVLWEMFLRSLDDNIVHYNLFDKLSRSFFTENKSDRFNIILENIEYLHSNNLEIYNKWKDRFFPFSNNYSYWLAKIIQKKN